MSRHYRRGLPKLLRALDFHCDDTAFQPVMDALKLLDRYADSEGVFHDRGQLELAAGQAPPDDPVQQSIRRKTEQLRRAQEVGHLDPPGRRRTS